MYEVIKTIRGRQYRYLQRSYRAGGKVRTQSIYLGPVDPARRKKLDLKGLLAGALSIGVHVAKHGTASRHYRVKDRESGRTASTRAAQLRELYKLYGVDTSSVAAFRATVGVLSQEQRWALAQERSAAGRVAKAPEPLTDGMKEFAERVAATKTAQDARHAAQDAPGRTHEAPARDFTVDDAIDARQAAHDRAVDEYNAGTEAAPATPAPDDAPLPDGPSQPSAPAGDAGQASSA